jgi:hypothetical protein
VVPADRCRPSAFHAYPSTLRADGISGDYGPGFFGHTVATGVYLDRHPELGWIAFGGNFTVEGDMVRLRPLDSARSRVYLAPLGLWLTLDAGSFEMVEMSAGGVRLTLASATPDTPRARPSGVGDYRPAEDFPLERGAFVIPLGRGSTEVVLGLDPQRREGLFPASQSNPASTTR